MNKNKMLLILVVSAFGFVGCGEVSSTSNIPSTNNIPTTTLTPTTVTPKNTYTITWKNYDGSILEVDEKVEEGTMPVYDGEQPSRANDDTNMYIFTGWTPSVSVATKDETYTATYTSITIDGKTPGISPVLSSDGKTIEYGFYPQTNVKDEKIIQELNALTNPMNNGWYSYNGEYYAKTVAKVYNNEAYTFDNGTSIQNDKTYWFKCETIKWNVLSSSNGVYTLLSTVLLDAHSYYGDYYNRNDAQGTVYPNSYIKSDIRSWLNNDFFNEAFLLNDEFVKDTNVDNSAPTTDIANNKYACENTIDKVFLPSYQDYLNTSYGFDGDASIKSNTRVCKTTDYSRARGAWYNTNSSMLYNGSYWTRSPSSEFNYASWNVNTAGYLSTYVVDGSEHSVRPAINITIE